LVLVAVTGSLDREQFVRLLDDLAEVREDGYGTMCTAYCSPLASGDFDNHPLFRCELRSCAPTRAR
jgi:hypothetical protein